MNFSVLEIIATGGDNTAGNQSTNLRQKYAAYHMLEIHFTAREHFPLFHVFLLPTIEKILATNTSQFPTMYCRRQYV